jgi:MFS transporter, DHA3 family, macrolide efflux protein
MLHQKNALLQNHHFLILWFAQTFSNFGDAFFRLALPWLVIEMGGTANILGGVFLSTILPGIAFSLLGGVFADKGNRKYILMLANFLRAILMFIFFLLLFFKAIAFYQLYILGILLGIIGAFANPAFDAMLPSLVHKDNLQKANALFALGDDIAYTSGPLVAGLLVAFIGVKGISLVNALSFVILALALSVLKVAKSVNAQVSNTSFFNSVLEVLNSFGIMWFYKYF